MTRAPSIDLSLRFENRNWLPPVDHEGIPFRCKRCFLTRHLVANCVKRMQHKHATWRREVSSHHYLVEKDGSDAPKELKELKGKEPKKAIGEVENAKKESVNVECFPTTQKIENQTCL